MTHIPPSEIVKQEAQIQLAGPLTSRKRVNMIKEENSLCDSVCATKGYDRRVNSVSIGEIMHAIVPRHGLEYVTTSRGLNS